VLSIVCVDPTTFIVGHGDGTLKKVVGQEKEWKVVQEISLVGGVTNLTLAMDQQELIAGTNTGIVYRVLTSDLTFTHLMESHVSTVRRVVFPHLRSDLFVSTGDDGYVKKWDLSDYSVTSSFTLNSNPHKVSANVVPLCASFTPNDALVMTGWTDGFIRGLDLSGAQGSVVWQIVNGHKGAVNVIISATPYFCTAGEDCVVRVWAHQNREQLIQISEHKKPITNIVVDNTTEAIIHTVSLDKYLYTYDIYKSDIAKTAKRLTYHCDIDGQGFSGAAQRRDNEHEMIVGTVDGRLLTYDIDYQQPTLTLTDPSRAIVNSVAISSSGTHLACGNGEGKLHMYDLQQTPPRLLGSVRLHSQDILSVAWSPDEKQLVTCGRDGAICVWNFYAGST
jgi:WD40 repeat protein